MKVRTKRKSGNPARWMKELPGSERYAGSGRGIEQQTVVAQFVIHRMQIKSNLLVHVLYTCGINKQGEIL